VPARANRYWDKNASSLIISSAIILLMNRDGRESVPAMGQRAMNPPRFTFREQREMPAPAAAAVAMPSGFMCCPLPVQQGLATGDPAWMQLYRWAYEAAQAVTQPSLLERFLAPSLN
jgi:hypothetical protein